MTQTHTGLLSPAELFGMSGMEYFSGVIEGKYPAPPICDTVPMEFVEASPERLILSSQATEQFLNPMGTVHAGFTATLLDTAAACIVHISLTAGEAYTTLEIKLTLHRAITRETGELRVEGNMVNRGRRVAASKSSVSDSRGRLLASATSTCLIMPASEVRG
ncbi:PaaI family thioesterase [Amaricoccus tamworthensis]|uniref:PaaI family thioesterase n=1 Tax=Amaricoccus tamworthensis TaxID=57002 RepID=UPI003C7B5A4F